MLAGAAKGTALLLTVAIVASEEGAVETESIVLVVAARTIRLSSSADPGGVKVES
jgi:hypothetical protein